MARYNQAGRSGYAKSDPQGDSEERANGKAEKGWNRVQNEAPGRPKPPGVIYRRDSDTSRSGERPHDPKRTG